MIRFSLFGIPVSIHPTLWLTLALLGGAIGISSMAEFLSVALFIIAAFICLLVHEFGHAIVGRRLGGGHPHVYLAWMGGDCSNTEARLTRMQGVIMTAAGPLATVLLAVVTTLVLGLYLQDVPKAFALASRFMVGQLPVEALSLCPPMAMFFFFYLVEVACWWTILNLLPIFPLDGGQIMHGLMKSPRLMHSISFCAACVFTAFFCVAGMWLMAVFMVMLAFLNQRFYSQAPY